MRCDRQLWLVALTLSGCAGLGGGAPRQPSAPTHIAYIDDGRLHVITATGRTVLTYPRKPVMQLPGGRVWDCTYRDPQVHSDGNRVLVIQDCQREQPPAARIVEFALDAPHAPPRILYQGAGRGLQFPAWSSDGRRLAFLELGDVVACASDCQETFRTKLPRTHGAWTQLVWQPNQRRVLVRAGAPEGATSIAAVNPDLGVFEWLAEHLDRAQLDAWIAAPTNAPAVRGLFGSSANPREPIAWSPDGRYYFYEAFDQHFRNRGAGWGSHWIAGYDTERAKIRRIKTVARTFNIPPFSWIE